MATNGVLRKCRSLLQIGVRCGLLVALMAALTTVSGCGSNDPRSIICFIDPSSFEKDPVNLGNRLFKLINLGRSEDDIEFFTMGNHDLGLRLDLTGSPAQRIVDTRKLIAKRWVGALIDSLRRSPESFRAVDYAEEYSRIVEAAKRRETVGRKIIVSFSDMLYEDDQTQVDFSNGYVSDSFIYRESSPLYVNPTDLGECTVLICTSEDIPQDRLIRKRVVRFQRLFFQRLGAHLEYYGPDMDPLLQVMSGYKAEGVFVTPYDPDGRLEYTPHRVQGASAPEEFLHSIQLRTVSYPSTNERVDVKIEVTDMKDNTLYPAGGVGGDFVLHQPSASESILYFNSDPGDLVLKVHCGFQESESVLVKLSIHSPQVGTWHQNYTFHEPGTWIREWTNQRQAKASVTG